MSDLSSSAMRLLRRVRKAPVPRFGPSVDKSDVQALLDMGLISLTDLADPSDPRSGNTLTVTWQGTQAVKIHNDRWRDRTVSGVIGFCLGVITAVVSQWLIRVLQIG